MVQNTPSSFHYSRVVTTNGNLFLGNNTFIQNPMMSVMFCCFLYLVSLNSLLQQLYRILEEIFSDLLNPVLMTSIVFVALFAILSVLDCFLGEDGWYLVDLKQSQDAKHYFGEERFVIVGKIQLSI